MYLRSGRSSALVVCIPYGPVFGCLHTPISQQHLPQHKSEPCAEYSILRLRLGDARYIWAPIEYSGWCYGGELCPQHMIRGNRLQSRIVHGSTQMKDQLDKHTVTYNAFETWKVNPKSPCPPPVQSRSGLAPHIIIAPSYWRHTKSKAYSLTRRLSSRIGGVRPD
jgi:hypothetical protein